MADSFSFVKVPVFLRVFWRKVVAETRRNPLRNLHETKEELPGVIEEQVSAINTGSCLLKGDKGLVSSV